MVISFKIAEIADIDILLGFMRDLFESDNPPPDQTFEGQKARMAMIGLLENPVFGRAWLILCDNQAAGYVVLTLGYSLEYHGRDAFLDELFIAEPYRGQGVGRRAIALVEETCRHLGVNALHLEVERPNIAAHSLYRKVGFVDHDRYLMTKWL